MDCSRCDVLFWPCAPPPCPCCCCCCCWSNIERPAAFSAAACLPGETVRRRRTEKNRRDKHKVDQPDTNAQHTEPPVNARTRSGDGRRRRHTTNDVRTDNDTGRPTDCIGVSARVCLCARRRRRRHTSYIPQHARARAARVSADRGVTEYGTCVCVCVYTRF